MDHTRLGRTGLDVSVACLGCGGASKLGQSYGASFADSVGLVRAALDNGVNIIDTAAGYGTEEIVGIAIKDRRDKVIVSTKSAITERQRTPGGDVIRGTVFAARVDGCLARLRTDYLDIMYVHGLQERHYDYCVAEILPALFRLREQGKVRFIGVSEGWGQDPRHKMLERALQDDYFDVMMVGLNVVNHNAVTRVLPLAKKRDVGIQCMYAVRGRLGRIDLAAHVIGAAVRLGEVDLADVDPADPLGFLLSPDGAASLVEACYRFARHAPGVDTLLTGTGRVDHLVENISYINAPPLPDHTLARVKRVFGRVESVTGD